jgi:tRNA threonylcarbamoyladenosine biosynthesis protein TsaB
LITLIIDTSTDKSLIACAQGNQLLLAVRLPHGFQSSRYLMGAIEEGLKQVKCLPSSLQAIAVAIGPGSYTGIRVGVAAAKGLAFPKSLPLVGFCSLEGFVSEKEGRFLSLIDARIGGFYVLPQERVGSSVHPLSSPQLISKENLSDLLHEYPTQVGPHTSYPDPSHLAHLTAEKLENEEHGSDLDVLYLRTPDYQPAF